MFRKKSLFVPAALILAAFLGVSAANAQNPACPYTLASLQGSYGIVSTYGANVAMGLATRSYDGNGNLTGTFTVNQPTAGSTTGARTIVTGTHAGTYTVNCNGTGTISKLTTANGTTNASVDDFVITTAVRSLGGQGNVMVATTIAEAQQIPSTVVPGGVFLTRIETRLADALTVWK